MSGWARSCETFATRIQARARVAAWIEDYNRRRRRSVLKMLKMMSPVDYEHAVAIGESGLDEPASPAIQHPQVLFKSFLLGPCRPAGSAWTHLRSGSYIAANEAGQASKISAIKVSTLSGEPRVT